MTNHRLTWRRWLLELAPVHEDDFDALLEALCLAAPQGPRGVRCVDDCRCHDSAARLASNLYTELTDVTRMSVSEAKSDLLELKRAVELDLVTPPERRFEARTLAEIDVTVSPHNAHVSAVREDWPSTWEAVMTLVRQRS